MRAYPHIPYLKTLEFEEFAGWKPYSSELKRIGIEAIKESA